MLVRIPHGRVADIRIQVEGIADDAGRRPLLCAVFLLRASECELDKQGRILLPQKLRDYAGLDKDCTLIGVSNRVEIWDSNVWAAYATEAETSFADIAENLVDFSF